MSLSRHLAELIGRQGIFTRFVVSGATCALLFFCLYYAGLSLGLRPFAANLAAYAIAFSAGYGLQRGWTFGGRHRHSSAAPRYALVQACCALFTSGVTQVATAYLHIPDLAMSLLATVFAGAASYVASRLWVFPEGAPNTQYNVAKSGSLPVKVAAYQRRRMFDHFLKATAIAPDETLLDVGATSERTYEASNYVEAWYPHKAKITALGLDDAAFLEAEYPGMRFVRGDGRSLPFEDLEFDVVHSSAVLEHVGSFEQQVSFIAECARVTRKSLYLTTPNRWFPIEFHTVLPLAHWLPRKMFRGLMRRTGRGFFAEESNLNLMGPGDLRRAAEAALRPRGFSFEISSANLLGWPSNLLLVAHRNPTGR